MFSLGREPQEPANQSTNEPLKGRQMFSLGREPQEPANQSTNEPLKGAADN